MESTDLGNAVPQVTRGKLGQAAKPILLQPTTTTRCHRTRE
jgi:hypothetical protein